MNTFYQTTSRNSTVVLVFSNQESGFSTRFRQIAANFPEPPPILFRTPTVRLLTARRPRSPHHLVRLSSILICQKDAVDPNAITDRKTSISTWRNPPKNAHGGSGRQKGRNSESETSELQTEISAGTQQIKKIMNRPGLGNTYDSGQTTGPPK